LLWARFVELGEVPDVADDRVGAERAWPLANIKALPEAAFLDSKTFALGPGCIKVKPRRADEFVVEGEADKTVERFPVGINRVGDIAEQFVVVHFAQRPKRARAVTMFGDGEIFPADFLAFPQIKDLSGCGGVLHGRFPSNLGQSSLVEEKGVDLEQTKNNAAPGKV
jgi:hypothetical protein